MVSMRACWPSGCRISNAHTCRQRQYIHDQVRFGKQHGIVSWAFELILRLRGLRSAGCRFRPENRAGYYCGLQCKLFAFGDARVRESQASCGFTRSAGLGGRTPKSIPKRKTGLYPCFSGITAKPTDVLTNPPPFLDELGLGRMGPIIRVSDAGPDSRRCVSLLYSDSFCFGGPGHWIVAGHEKLTVSTNSHCLKLISGVYFQPCHSGGTRNW